MGESYCVKCKKQTQSKGEKVVVAAKGPNKITSTCATCGTKKTKFVSKKQK